MMSERRRGPGPDPSWTVLVIMAITIGAILLSMLVGSQFR